MSVKVQSRVWEHSQATGNALIVLLKIADNADDSGNNAWPSIARLAHYCRCSRSTVKRSLRELVELGELEVVQRGGGRGQGSRYGSNLYRVVIDGGQNHPPRTSRGGSPGTHRWSKSPPRGGPLVDHNSSGDPSITASEAGSELRAIHLRLSREALGIHRPGDGETAR